MFLSRESLLTLSNVHKKPTNYVQKNISKTSFKKNSSGVSIDRSSKKAKKLFLENYCNLTDEQNILNQIKAFCFGYVEY
jgi:hypothetical protein